MPQSRRTFLRQAGAAAPLAIAPAALADQPEAKLAVIRRIVAPGAVGPFSRAVVFGDLVFVSGVLGVRPGTRELASAEFEAQCRQTLENLRASVEAAGSSFARVLKCTCFLTAATDFAAMNRVYSTFFTDGLPARSTVVVKELVLSGAMIEFDCIAAAP
ncbi:MAG: Rid family detoxifying hydrolase [Phycisphaerae bacterium]|nr:Rid family detoxifying hydrolase [Phycisphaerae bacterium]